MILFQRTESLNFSHLPETGPAGLDRSYLPELDSLRFFAFLLVFAFHNGLPGLGGLIRDVCAMTIDLPMLIAFGSGGIGGRFGKMVDHALQANGWIGVNLFFTLSGFIITRLLLKEELQFGRIDWRAFWFRRILRIWPLYYVIFLIGFAGFQFSPKLHLPGIGFGSPQVPWFGLFLGNWSMIHYGPIGSDVLSVLWSVCVEEQFYVVIPILLALSGTRGRWLTCICGIGFAACRRWQLAALGVEQYRMTYDSLAQMDSILSGVLLALALNDYYIRNILAEFTRKRLVWAVLPATLFLLTRHHLGHDILYRRVIDPLALCLGSVSWVLVAACGGSRWNRFLARRGFVALGRISYGLYMWHEVLLKLNGGGFGTLVGVVLTAWASYHMLEKPVLRYKNRWSRIESRPV